MYPPYRRRAEPPIMFTDGLHYHRLLDRNLEPAFRIRSVMFGVPTCGERLTQDTQATIRP